MANLKMSVGMPVIESNSGFVGIQRVGELPGFLQTIAELNANRNVIWVVLQVRGVMLSCLAPAFSISRSISCPTNLALRALEAENSANWA